MEFVVSTPCSKHSAKRTTLDGFVVDFIQLFNGCLGLSRGVCGSLGLADGVCGRLDGEIAIAVISCDRSLDADVRSGVWSIGKETDAFFNTDFEFDLETTGNFDPAL